MEWLMYVVVYIFQVVVLLGAAEDFEAVEAAVGALAENVVRGVAKAARVHRLVDSWVE
jgi:hypothetical protein